MNIEIANRLAKLRKEKGLSQEQLAESLGISRQAVSKWERAETSPDTDNLIELSKLYNVSIDYLLGINVSNNETEENIEKIELSPECVDIIDGGDKVHIGKDGVVITNDDEERKIDLCKNKRIQKTIFCSTVMALCLLTYILLGAFLSWWHPAWLTFLLGLVICSLPDTIMKKKLSDFSYPLFITTLYLFLGFIFNLWHPFWFLFITIPIFYTIAGNIDKIFALKRENTK